MIHAPAFRHRLIDAVRRTVQYDLNRGRAGNVSARLGDGFMITPSGVAPDALAPADLVFVEFDGTHDGTDRGRRPSSEWRFHRDIYAARPETRAIVHGHPPFATALACHRKAIPAFHYMIAVAGGHDIRCAEYATFGTQALSDSVLAALAERSACLLANHGAIALGCDLDDALERAVAVEELAEQYWRALQLGDPVILPDDEMARVIEKFRGYGRNAQTGAETGPETDMRPAAG